jgi:hypothetical protein
MSLELDKDGGGEGRRFRRRAVYNLVDHNIDRTCFDMWRRIAPNAKTKIRKVANTLKSGWENALGRPNLGAKH